MAQYHSGSNVWKTYGYSNYETGGASDIDRKRNQLYVLNTHYIPAGEAYPFRLRRLDLNSPSSLIAQPGVQQRNGTYGRFRYSAKYGVFVLVNDAFHDVSLYKP